MIERTSTRRAKSLGSAVVLMAAPLILLACGPASAPTATRETRAPAAPKTLNLGERNEPTTVVFYGRLGEGGTTTSRYERFLIFHGNLTVFDDQGNVLPRAAVKVPTIQDGDWKVSPEGAMEVTWKIRPDVFWHDGTPLTADDFVFGFDVIRDPKLAVSGLGEIANISSVKALDPKTIQVAWKKLSIQGNSNPVEGVPAIAKHQLEDAYRTMDAPVFAASPAWKGEFIGIGPYRVTQFEVGSYIAGEAYDQYFLGRPKIDRLVIRWAPDTQVMVAQLLAGALDYIAPGASAFPDQLVEIRRQLGTNAGLISLAAVDVRVLWLNLRADGQPWDPGQAGWQRDVRFRQAMLHSMNRQRLADDLQYGFTPVLYFPAFPDFPIYQLALQRGLPKYEYDPVRAQRLFAEAGWNKGPDGLLRNSAGQVVHFTCCRDADVALGSDLQESLGWGVDFQTAGLEVENPIPPRLTAGLSATEQRRVRTVGWGGTISNWRLTAGEHFANLTRANIAREETSWSGNNTAAWSNPIYDDLFTKALSTIEPAPRLETEFQMLKIIMDELPIFPVYYDPIGLAARKGVTGIGPGSAFNHANTADIHLWDITS